MCSNNNRQQQQHQEKKTKSSHQYSRRAAILHIKCNAPRALHVSEYLSSTAPFIFEKNLKIQKKKPNRLL
jgi:hypothetical protein